MINNIAKWGLDSQCTRLIILGYNNEQILELLNRDRGDEAKVTKEDLTDWRKEVESNQEET